MRAQADEAWKRNGDLPLPCTHSTCQAKPPLARQKYSKKQRWETAKTHSVRPILSKPALPWSAAAVHDDADACPHTCMFASTAGQGPRAAMHCRGCRAGTLCECLVAGCTACPHHVAVQDGARGKYGSEDPAHVDSCCTFAEGLRWGAEAGQGEHLAGYTA